jgi:hypothetical protein
LVGQTPRAFSPNRTRRETGEAGENLRFITALSARDLILQGKARSDETDTLGAHFVAAPPDHFVCVFPDYTVTGTEQHEFIGSVESVKEEPHAAVGDVDYEAVARWNSGSELDFCYAVEAAAWRPASLPGQ